MSRRTPNAAAERAAQNAQTIKSLLKLEGNKTCADCKRNKHPRWASWNLGVFICIRCSGIHRGMGTHISRVKSVDLDSWTDEQLQSALKWGNLKANKYWEAKLAAGHVPSESKMENFIRTKYESKRWVMEGPMPDPSTLEVDGDDDVPLSLVKEKQTIERSASQRSQTSGPSQIKRAPQPDLFGDDNSPKASAASKTVARIDPTPVKQTKPADSLLGLDFFGTEINPPSRPSSALPTIGSQSRPDLKQSILSLYASTARPPQQQQPPQNSLGTFGSIQSVTTPPNRKTSFGVINDAFSSFNLSNQKSPQIQSPSKASSLMNLGNDSNHRKNSSQSSSSLSGGTFFDAKPSPSPIYAQQPSGGLHSFSAFESVKSPPSTINTTKLSSGLGEMFDFATPAPQTSSQKPTDVFPSATKTSVFNLSQTSQVKVSSPPAISNAWSTQDNWGASNAWGDTTKGSTENQSAPSPSKPENPGWGAPVEPPAKPSAVINEQIGNGFAALNGPPKISADEDFGSWSSAAPVAPASNTAIAKPAAGFAGNDDLFSNVWG